MRTKSPGPDCLNIKRLRLTRKEKEIIVEKHNDLRRYVTLGKEENKKQERFPQAANMMEMKWDEELALLAQGWADQCKFGHDKSRSTKRFGELGQNVMAVTVCKGDADFKRLIKVWYNEVRSFPLSSLERFDSKAGHFTQVIWASSRYVGCGRTQEKRRCMFVCNYGPAGNFMYQRVYKIGKPCSKCPNNTVCNDNLCSRSRRSSHGRPELLFLFILFWKFLI